MTERPTIKDVARRAGVSKSTVSLVLREAKAVRPETRLRVQEAMQELGYVYNRSAARLRGARTGLVGLVVNNLRNPFFTELSCGAQMRFSRRGYATVVGNSDESRDLQRQIVDSMLEHGVAALILSPCHSHDRSLFDDIDRAKVPTLQVIRLGDERTDRFPFFSMDFEGGSALACNHLLSRGARRVAFVGGVAGWRTTTERVSGYLNALGEYGLAPETFFGPPSRAFGAEVARHLVRGRQDVTAAVCFNDFVALGMHSALAREGIVVGKDFLLVGFDDIEECRQSHPQLSSVRCDIGEFGEAAAARVLNWLEDANQPPDAERASVRLIVRESSGA